MEQVLPLAGYSAGIAAAALASAGIPLWLERRIGRIEILLAGSAGVMLGAAFFHMLPEAIRGGGPAVVPFAAVGLLALFLLERFVLVHVCEEPEEGCDVHPTVGLAAFLGLAAHTLVDGVALAAATGAGVGVLVFVAILAHKVPASVTLSSILVASGYSRARVLGMTLVLALMIPAGAAAYALAGRAVPAQEFTPAAIAFSAGTFLHLALSDLLPDVHRRAGTRAPPMVALLAGIGLMWAIARIG